jgi:ZIP family zinc transporter
MRRCETNAVLRNVKLENIMLEAAAWGLIASSSLVIGSVLTFWLKPSRRLIGLIMAFGAGTLIAAIAYELVAEAAASGRMLMLAVGLAGGALAFFVGDWWVDRAGGEHRKRSSGAQAQGNSFAFLSARCWTVSRIAYRAHRC